MIYLLITLGSLLLLKIAADVFRRTRQRGDFSGYWRRNELIRHERHERAAWRNYYD